MRLTDAITNGSRRVVTRTGGLVFVALVLQQALIVTSANTVITTQAPDQVTDTVGLTLPVSGAVAGALLVGLLFVSAGYFVVVARAFARPLTELSSIHSDLYTRRIGRASLTLLVSGIIVSIVVMLGFPFLILPGLFFATCFIFVSFTVGIEDRGVIDALKRSWGLTAGSRLRLGVIILLAGVAGISVGIVPTILQLAGAMALADAVTVLTNSLLVTFLYAVIAAAYLQLTNDEGRIGGTKTATASADTTAQI